MSLMSAPSIVKYRPSRLLMRPITPTTHRLLCFSQQYHSAPFLPILFIQFPTGFPLHSIRALSTSTTQPRQSHLGGRMVEHGDLNNSHAAREKVELAVDPTYHGKSFAIAEAADDATVRELYRPFLLPPSAAANDWVAELELSTVLKFVESELRNHKRDRIRILVLYGSLRTRQVIPCHILLLLSFYSAKQTRQVLLAPSGIRGSSHSLSPWMRREGL